MAVSKISPEDLFLSFNTTLIIDVRSEGEYCHARIPGAHSLPLFNNAERAVVGTAYKQQSRQQAIKLGLEIFGKKMVAMVGEVERLTNSLPETATTANSSLQTNHSKTVIVHCWRGGMRSAGVAWLLDLYGFKVYTIAGGYKAFRNWSLLQFSQAYNLKILGGFTGSGKTYTLEEMNALGAATINLEGLARHKGSAFGNLGMPDQPSQEMFENMLAVALWNTKHSTGKSIEHDSDHHRGGKPIPIWIEDESQRIGNLNIPNLLWEQMRSSPVFFLNVDFESRLRHIVEEYGIYSKEHLINATVRIKKKLGGLETKTAVNYLIEDNTENCFRILLQYYDKLYNRGLEKRDLIADNITTINCTEVNPGLNAAKILKHTYE